MQSRMITCEDFLDAIERGNEDIVECYIEQNRNHLPAAVNFVGYDGKTPLMLASLTGDYGIVCKLLAIPGININSTGNTYGSTALLFAADRGYTDIVCALLDAGIDVNARNSSKWTPLTAAVFYGHVDIVNRLLAAPNIDINAETVHGDSALQLALTYPHSNEVARRMALALLAQPNIDVTLQDHNGKTAIDTARSRGFNDIVNLISSGIPAAATSLPIINDARQFLVAALDGNITSVEAYLARHRETPNAINVADPVSGNTALIYAAMGGHDAIINALTNIQELNINAVNHAGETAAMIAQSKGHFAIATTLIALASSDEYDTAATVSRTSATTAATNSQATEIPTTFAQRLAKVNYKGDIPKKYICPVSLDIMEDPIVIYSSGQAYDKASLLKCFEHKKNSKKNPNSILCPLTKKPIYRYEFDKTVVCIVIREEIEGFVATIEAAAKNQLVDSVSTTNAVETLDIENLRANRLLFFGQVQKAAAKSTPPPPPHP